MSARVPVESAFQRGLALVRAGRHVRGARELERALREGGTDAPWACQEIVNACLSRGDPAGAEARLTALLPADSALLLHGLAYLRRRTGRADEAMQLLREADARRGRPWAVRNELGWLLASRGRTAEGLALLRSAGRAFQRAGDDWGLATALTHEATLLTAAWKLNAARELFARAEQLKRRCGDRLGLATVLHNSGSIHFHGADHLRAREAFESARRLYREAGHDEGEAAAASALGACFLELAEPERAEEVLRAALSVFRRSSHPLARAREAAVRVNLAEARLLLDDLRGAARLHAETLDLHRETEDAPGHAQTVANLAEVRTLSGRPELALAEVARLPRHVRAQAGVRPRVALWREEARAHLALGDAVAATRAARRALAEGRRVPGPSDSLFFQLVGSRTLLGRALVSGGRREDGLRHLRRAVADVDRLLDHQPVRTLRMGLREALRAPEDALVDALGQSARGGASRAWAHARRGKARELGTGAPLGFPRPGTLDELGAEIRFLSSREELSRADRRRLGELRTRYLEVGDRRAQSCSRRVGSPASAAQLQEALGDETVLFEYHATRETTLLFVVHGGAVRCIDLGVSGAWLSRRIGRVAREMATIARCRDPGPRLAELDAEPLRILHRRLVRPGLEVVARPARRLIVVPDGPLHALPFPLLVRGRAGAAPRWGDPWGQLAGVDWLGDHLAVGTALSSEALRRPPRLPRRPRFLGLAFSPRRGTVVQGAAGPLHLAPLPESGREVRRAAACFADAVACVGPAATPAAYLEQAPRADVVHVAAHAISDARAPELSGLVLAPEDGAAVGFLTADRIAAVRLRAQLVVLSACESAGGRLRWREGVVGLARAFLDAGASAVLATLWPIDDRTARELAVKFYRELLQGSDRIAALAEARRALRRAREREGFRRHPFFWAPFQLTDHAPGG